MHPFSPPLSRRPLAIALAMLAAAILFVPAKTEAYSSEVNKCISNYTYTSQPRLARNTLKAACLCSHNSSRNTCSQWPAERIDCVQEHMPGATDNNAARQVNLYCNRKARLRHN